MSPKDAMDSIVRRSKNQKHYSEFCNDKEWGWILKWFVFKTFRQKTFGLSWNRRPVHMVLIKLRLIHRHGKPIAKILISLNYFLKKIKSQIRPFLWIYGACSSDNSVDLSAMSIHPPIGGKLKVRSNRPPITEISISLLNFHFSWTTCETF